jgi:hypothetical protein
MINSTKLNESDHGFIYGRTSEGMTQLPGLSPESVSSVIKNMAPDCVYKIKQNIDKIGKY